jgi:cytochrome c oxidase cbb3-type subunit 3/ubiquinol-cytochrome c reductase cytochrome c subunit
VLDFATLYRQNCSACHGENGKNGAAIALNNSVYLALAGTANIERITADGVPNTAMPPFARSKGGMLTDNQIAILAVGAEQNWSNSSALAGTTPPTYATDAPGNSAQGQHVFATDCAQCHGADGTGGKAPSGAVLGSLLDPSYLALISDQGLRSVIIAGQTEHGAHDWRSYRPQHPMTNQEIADTVAWLVSHRTATPGQVYQQHP